MFCNSVSLSVALALNPKPFSGVLTYCRTTVTAIDSYKLCSVLSGIVLHYFAHLLKEGTYKILHLPIVYVHELVHLPCDAIINILVLL